MRFIQVFSPTSSLILDHHMELILQKNEYVAADNSITVILDLVQTGFEDKELAVHIPESNRWNVKEITGQAIDGVFRYSIELQFFGSRSSRRTIPIEVLNVTKSGSPIIHKEKLDLVVRNLDKRQKPTVKVSLDRFGPSITGHLNPIIELSLKLNLNATAQLLPASALRYTATVFVNQKEVWQQEAIETNHLKIETQDAFSKGKTG
ncbi:hypothetical protein BI334_33180 [Moorena producens 3L]|nr:hypothetical protein BI334_33180 [Moorena producens 3L]